MSRTTRSGLFCVATITLLAGPAVAFCQTTTCVENCRKDPDGCNIDGRPLSWPNGCVTFSVDGQGSERLDISSSEFADVVKLALQTWIGADCEGDYPAIEVSSLGISQCGFPEHNTLGANTNEWMFRDEDWPYHAMGAEDLGELNASELAVTTLTFDPESGALLDADVEINTHTFPFSLLPEEDDVDLLSIATHEAGHFMGLDHSRDQDAVMSGFYESGSVEHRQLSTDDELGICTLYSDPQDIELDACGPRNGYSIDCQSSMSEAGCGCSLRPRHVDGTVGFGFGFVLALVLVALRRRAFTQTGSHSIR